MNIWKSYMCFSCANTSHSRVIESFDFKTRATTTTTIKECRISKWAAWFTLPGGCKRFNDTSFTWRCGHGRASLWRQISRTRLFRGVCGISIPNNAGKRSYTMPTSPDNALVLFCNISLNTYDFCSLYIHDMSVGIHCENFVLCCN